MFSEDDDGFDIPEQAMLQAALDIEKLSDTTPSKSGVPGKRRSFELTDITNSKPKSITPGKIGQHVRISESAPTKLEQTKGSTTSSKIGPTENKFSFKNSSLSRPNIVENVASSTSSFVPTASNRSNINDQHAVQDQTYNMYKRPNPSALHGFQKTEHAGIEGQMKTPSKVQVSAAGMFQTSPDFDKVLESPPTWRPLPSANHGNCTTVGAFAKPINPLNSRNNNNYVNQTCTKQPLTEINSSISSVQCVASGGVEDFEEDPALLRGLLDEDFNISDENQNETSVGSLSNPPSRAQPYNKTNDDPKPISEVKNLRDPKFRNSFHQTTTSSTTCSFNVPKIVNTSNAVGATPVSTSSVLSPTLCIPNSSTPNIANPQHQPCIGFVKSQLKTSSTSSVVSQGARTVGSTAGAMTKPTSPNFHPRSCSAVSPGPAVSPGCSLWGRNEALSGGSPLTSVQTSAVKKTGDQNMKRKRKFPGPAGALPKRPPSSIADLSLPKQISPEKPIIKPVTMPPCSQDVGNSQSGEDLFSAGPWQNMKTELEKQANIILQKFNIDSVLKKAAKKELVRGKVPVICVLIDSLTSQCDDASVGLRDPSGEMKGTIHRQLMKEYPAEMIPGTVLVLRQVGVFSPSSRNHYLNITPNNVVRLYCRNSTGALDKHTLSKFINEDFIIPKLSPPPQNETNIAGMISKSGVKRVAECSSPNLAMNGANTRRPSSPWGMTGGPGNTALHPRGSPHTSMTSHPRHQIPNSAGNPRLNYSRGPTVSVTGAQVRPVPHNAGRAQPTVTHGPQFSSPGSVTSMQSSANRPRLPGNQTRYQSPSNPVRQSAPSVTGNYSSPQLRTVNATTQSSVVGSNLGSFGKTSALVLGASRLGGPVPTVHPGGEGSGRIAGTDITSPNSHTVPKGRFPGSVDLRMNSPNPSTTSCVTNVSERGRFSFKKSTGASCIAGAKLQGSVNGKDSMLLPAKSSGGQEVSKPMLQDLWQDQDDNLDDLLTDLPDEMMEEF